MEGYYMYKIGDLFIYGANGACKIADIKTENFNRNEKIYYILVPVFDIKETIFVPADNEQLVSKMKKILSSSKENYGFIVSDTKFVISTRKNSVQLCVWNQTDLLL